MIINTNRILCFSISCFLVLWIQAQTKIEGRKNSNVNIVYDVDSIPILEEESFYYLSTVKKFVSSNQFSLLKWKDDNQTFQAYFDSCYVNHLDYNERELNELPIVFILFDKTFKIQDVRVISRRLSYYYKEYNYSTLIKQIIRSTDGHWVKKDNSITTDWYYDILRFRLH